MDYPVSDPGSQLYEGKFTDGNPSLGIAASVDKAAHMSALYDEVLNVIRAAGLVPSETTLNQLLNAIQWLLNQGLATRAAVGHGHPWQDISGKPATFPPSSHPHQWSEIQNKPTLFPPTPHVDDYAHAAGNASTVGGYSAAQLWRTDQAMLIGGVNGAARLPSGWQLRWGRGTVSYAGTRLSFIDAFPTVCWFVLPGLATGGPGFVPRVGGWDQWGADFSGALNASTENIQYWAVGF